MANMQRRILQLEEQASKDGNERTGSLSRAAATLVVDIIHMDEDLSSEEREAAKINAGYGGVCGID